MGKKGKTKRHTHKSLTEEEVVGVPHSFVLHRGVVGSSLLQLEKDLRHVMEPYTAVHLKVKKSNVLKDFVHVAGPLGVTHLLILSKTDVGTYLKFARLPRGPTLTFKIQGYSLSKDVISLLKKPKTKGNQYKKPPLLVLNNFTTDELSMKLMTTMFQNMFPSINIQRIHLADIRRCVLLNYDADSDTLDFRHYNIEAVPVGMSRGVKKLIQIKIPNMSGLSDVSDFVLRGGCGYGSESEGEEPLESCMDLPQQMPGRGNIKSQQSAVRLTELGPRMSLQLVKIEEGLCTGDVLYHKYVSKTSKEIKEGKKRREELRKLRESRKKHQEQNVKRKMKAKEMNRLRSIAGQKEKPVSNSQNDSKYEGAGNDSSEGDGDDAWWYRKEVGKEPAHELSLSRKGKTHKGRRSSPEREVRGKKRPIQNVLEQEPAKKRGRASETKRQARHSMKRSSANPKSSRKDPSRFQSRTKAKKQRRN